MARKTTKLQLGRLFPDFGFTLFKVFSLLRWIFQSLDNFGHLPILITHSKYYTALSKYILMYQGRRKKKKAERAVARKTTKLQLGRLFPDDQTSMHLIPSISLTRHAALG